MPAPSADCSVRACRIRSRARLAQSASPATCSLIPSTPALSGASSVLRPTRLKAQRLEPRQSLDRTRATSSKPSGKPNLAEPRLNCRTAWAVGATVAEPVPGVRALPAREEGGSCRAERSPRPRAESPTTRSPRPRTYSSPAERHGTRTSQREVTLRRFAAGQGGHGGRRAGGVPLRRGERNRREEATEPSAWRVRSRKLITVLTDVPEVVDNGLGGRILRVGPFSF
jgi:hypothetical protein